MNVNTKDRRRSGGFGQLVFLVIVALVLAAGVIALDRFNAGTRDMLTVETRGMQVVSALTKYKLENGAYPDTLDKLVPKFAASVAACPGGSTIEYRLSGNDYMLGCENVVFKVQPYRYDSRTHSWSS
jgi:type II secretory pathway pseudopilin PulG